MRTMTISENQSSNLFQIVIEIYRVLTTVTVSNKVKENIHQIVDGITESYIKYPVSQSQFKCRLPNKTVITDITEKLLELLFPGYFGEYSPDRSALPYYVGDILLEVYHTLTKQIALAFNSKYDDDGSNDDLKIKDKAEDICHEFFQSIPNIRRILASDVKAALEGDPAAVDTDMVIFCYPGIYAIAIYRAAHKLLMLNTPYIPRIMTEYAHGKTGIDIHPGAQIGEYFFIDHGTGVVIGETSVIGNNVKLYQGVTLGALSTKGGQSLSGKKRHPTIEDNVTIYSGATVLGGDTIIRKNTVIGGNAFITESK